MASLWTMTGVIRDLTGQTFVFPIMLTVQHCWFNNCTEINLSFNAVQLITISNTFCLCYGTLTQPFVYN